MTDIAESQRAYAQAGPWDRLGAMLRIGVAVLFVAITVVFFATAKNGLVSASDAHLSPAAPAAVQN
ncbi:hypothetical protein L2D14_03105 [Thalassospiraceae bacterium LMO-JJ14]|nr:hypothetical protein L2D14_03105 [Thalassospiraceae bacterium LMO-JJ14]